MEPRKNIHSRKKIERKRNPLNRLFIMILTVLVVLSGGIFWAKAETIQKPDFKLKSYGPIDEDNGFPVWYKDSADTRLQLCLDVNDPYCALIPEEIPRPDEPISLKNNNFPEEGFYQLASSVIDLPNGGRAVGTFALEASWANGIPQDGDQIVFGRVRFRIDGLVTGNTYTITHPYGVDKLVATAADKKDPTNGEIRFVEDIGTTGGFTAAMNSRIGRFLKWDKDAPPGYVGDPNRDHAITGGYNNQNFFKVEGVGIGKGSCGDNCAETDQFSLMGKLATKAGVDVVRATYSRNVDQDGKALDGGTVDVFASTEEDKAYDIDVTTNKPGDLPIRMRGANGKYFARIPFTGDTPPLITVTNKTDKPVTVKKDINPVDKITGSATYNIGNKSLFVKALSSDKVNKTELTVEGFPGVIPESGVNIPTNYVPPSITIKSSIGGEVVIPVDIDGDPFGPLVANAGAPLTVRVGNLVTLDGTQSIGVVPGTTTIKWTQLSPGAKPVTLTGADTLTPTFTAATGMGVLEFQLLLTNPNGVTSTSTVKVTVENVAIPDPIPDVGSDQKVVQGTLVTLDGSKSKNAIDYTWIQTDINPKVTLDMTNPVKPTFMFPKKNVKYTFKLQVKGANGKIVESTKAVSISTVPDNISNVTAEFRTRISTWRVDGNSDIFGPGVSVTIYLVDTDANGNPRERELGKADVDTLGVFRFRGTGPALNQGGTLKIVSSSGGIKENVSFVRK
ncbi:IPT/TIG domain protein [Paenibacillus sp. BSR1-1]|uniref:PKD domain-containing protein n=1 Tax=Paenibacillus sp. BSR1-1 TaxID=3020845 RepID=UPI0025AFE279|nr:IPT/TIG domain protein [Paenibacillus sp. BSR1-1]MDN3015333.1 IPT/TIG domain protein [Paenibacillus sp. BSR1-1]